MLFRRWEVPASLLLLGMMCLLIICFLFGFVSLYSNASPNFLVDDQPPAILEMPT